MSSDLHELVTPYALDALDADERKRFERHLAECERCSEQLADLHQAAGALAFAAEGPEPPPGLRARILDSARAETAGKVVPFPRRRWVLPAVAAVAAAAACLAVGLGIWASSLSRSLDRERDALSRAHQAQISDAAAINTILSPDATQTPLSGPHTRGALSVTFQRYGVLVICEPLKAPPGKTFEAWVIHRGQPRPAGLFTGADGQCAVLPLTRRVPKGATVAVTLERAGGVDKPTTPILYRAEAV